MYRSLFLLKWCLIPLVLLGTEAEDFQLSEEGESEMPKPHTVRNVLKIFERHFKRHRIQQESLRLGSVKSNPNSKILRGTSHRQNQIPSQGQGSRKNQIPSQGQGSRKNQIPSKGQGSLQNPPQRQGSSSRIDSSTISWLSLPIYLFTSPSC